MAAFEIKLECAECGEELKMEFHDATLIAVISLCDACFNGAVAEKVLAITMDIDKGVHEVIGKQLKELDK